MNSLRLKTFFVLSVALLCICTVLAAIAAIFHLNQVVRLGDFASAPAAANTLLWQLAVLVLVAWLVGGGALAGVRRRFFCSLLLLRVHIEVSAHVQPGGAR